MCVDAQLDYGILDKHADLLWNAGRFATLRVLGIVLVSEAGFTLNSRTQGKSSVGTTRGSRGTDFKPQKSTRYMYTG